MRSRLITTALVASLLAGCGAHSLQPVQSLPVLPQTAGALPDVAQKGNGAQWVSFSPKTVAFLYSAIAQGPDGNMWFIDENAGQLVRMTLGGSVKEFSLAGALAGNAVSMTVGADKKFYISDEATSIVVVTQAGAAKAIAIPSGDNTSIDSNGLGPDGNVWFTEFNHIGKVTPAGKITEFAYPTQPGTNQYGGVTAGSDGNVWFAESSQNAIGRIVPATGKITMFAVSCTPAPVVLAKDKNVWFTCLTSSPMLGRITPAGAITVFSIGGTFGSNETEQFCERGNDGEPWCAYSNIVFRVNTSSQTITPFTAPLPSGSRLDAVAPGPDGNMWADAIGGTGTIDALVVDPMTVTPNKRTFTAAGQKATLTVAEKTVSTWTATSSDTAVATVVQGSSKSTFTVTATGIGTCTVKIEDASHNFVNVKITVT